MPSVKILAALFAISVVGASHHASPGQPHSTVSNDPSQSDASPFRDLPPELRWNIYQNLSGKDLLSASLVSKQEKATVDAMFNEVPRLRLQRCLVDKWQQAREYYRESSVGLFETIQQDDRWKKCFLKLNMPVKTCSLAPSIIESMHNTLYRHRDPFVVNYRKKVFENWCDLAENELFWWLGKLINKKRRQSQFIQFTWLAYMVEFIHDRQKAAQIQRMRLEASGSNKQVLPPLQLAGDILAMMDTYVRYPILIRSVVFESPFTVSIAMSWHVYWRARISSLAEPIRLDNRLTLHRHIFDDKADQKAFFQYLGQFLAQYFAQREPEWNFISTDGTRRGPNQEIEHYFYTGQLPENILDNGEQGVDLIQRHTPMHIASCYLDIDNAITLYDAAFTEVKHLSSVAYAGTSTKGTELLKHVFNDIFGAHSFKTKHINKFNLWKLVEGLGVLVVVCAMLHTPDNWAVFQSLFVEFLGAHPNDAAEIVKRVAINFQAIPKILNEQRDQDRFQQTLRRLDLVLPTLQSRVSQ